MTDDNMEVFQPYRKSLNLRLTHKYVGTWKHEDQWQYLGDITVQQKISQNLDWEDPCEPTVTNLMVDVKVTQMLPTGKDRDTAIRQALKDSFSHHGCSHEWDCCGCWSTSVRRVTRIDDGTYVLSLHSSRNY